ncbi:hypothetical protein CDG77_32505 [Nostoc sp. 'Peltigera membranacea cyanobiont' 213]|jgi:hypothetical protein|uniref:Uncharacterized protein n=3 Tax=Nostoc TaxID=1177 RepID=A0A5P8WIJ7_9NOSO|nr:MULTISPECIES: hypothetical protein [Nostoc]MBD2520032.1 hypothetical protein [Nostoc sp. FACHB-973]MBD2564886.1 hypothetical protein [Nostoc linckia FACHB-391]MBD2651443.1 hypothetical protein [Nostoc foliaceum FACHB-393]MBE9003175.1 hypothetical protein [Nostoc sp. LEGE 12447]MBE9003379.1 hypothetical protein [Nostoc sp. LEGE 12447]
MITENDDSVDAVNELVRKISIKETQLKIAQESNLIHTAEALENQLSQLQQELGDNSDTQLQSLMSL